MTKFSIFFCIWFLTLPAFSTEFSDYAAKQFAHSCGREKVHITVKKEHIEIFAQEVGEKFVPFVVYGYGDLKSKNCKKQRVTYICLLDTSANPLWSYISFGK
ncbi:hypothetical protein IKQ21_07765 [bacterium]|nr:hypothetical protein [bacterium]